jgi:branched-chain amino acid transport system permease protein
MPDPTLHVSRTTRLSTISMAVMIVAVIVLACAPWWASRADIRLFGEISLFIALASLWNLLAGYAGLVSVGQQAYVGLGGYVFFGLTLLAGLNPLVALILAPLAGVIVAAPVAVLIFRLRGAYFAIGTWVVSEVFRLTAAQVSALGGGSGISLPVSVVTALAPGRFLREALVYWMALGVAVLVTAAVFFFLRSHRGVALMAIRDNELAAKSLGIDIWTTKFVVYLVTAGLTTLVGALIFLQKLRVSPDAAFSSNDWTAFVIFIVVIGGVGTIEGPIIGTLIYFALRETLADLGTIYLIALGVVAIIIMLKAPSGVWGLIRGRRGLELFPISSRIRGLDEKGA